MLMYGAMLAVSISKGTPIAWNEEYTALLPVADDIGHEAYSWIPRVVAKIEADLVRLGFGEPRASYILRSILVRVLDLSLLLGSRGVCSVCRFTALIGSAMQ